MSIEYFSIINTQEKIKYSISCYNEHLISLYNQTYNKVKHNLYEHIPKGTLQGQLFSIR